MRFAPPAPTARKTPRALVPATAVAALLVLGNSGCFLQHHANTNPLAAVKSQQPDKVLFDAAEKDMSQGKYTVARLDFETLLNTYPDSEYLAQAKLGIANSWYEEGGIDGLAQAEAQYEDFITFFPAMKEAAQAQLRIASIHFQQIEKPDRDPTQANEAQQDLRTFLTNYPDSSLRPKALQMLRQTQEVLAEREYLIGQFYLERAESGQYTDYRAAQSRMSDVLTKYPLYSRGDLVTDDLAGAYLTTANLYAGAAALYTSDKITHNLYLANENSDRAKAIAYYQHLIERYPESPYTADARKQLAQLKATIPVPSKEAIAFNKAEIAGRTKAIHSTGILAKVGVDAIFDSHPAQQFARADKVGTPPMLAEATPPEAPPPGLAQLVQETIKLPGGDKQILARIGAAEDGPGASMLTDPGSAAAPVAAAATAQSSAPLAFQDVTNAKARGADTPESPTPQAVSGNNNNDPNAHPVAAAPDPNLILTPNEVDLENRDQILAAEIHRDVPAPLSQLRTALKNAQEAQAKLMARLKKVVAEKKASDKKTPTPPPVIPH